MGHHRVVADHLTADHLEHLRHAGVHLARHDGRARLHRRQLDLGEARRRAGEHQPEIAGDLKQGRRQIPRRSGHFEEVACALRDLHPVLRRPKVRDSCVLLQLLKRDHPVLDRGIDACAHCGRADVQLLQAVQRGPDLPLAFRDAHGVGAELLAQPNGDGVAEVRASGFQDIVELPRLRPQDVCQLGNTSAKSVPKPQGGKAHGGGEHIVRGLRHVHMVVRMHDFIVAPRSAEQFKRAVGYHLVRVHVMGGACPGLEDVNDELVVPFAVDDLVRGVPNRCVPSSSGRRSVCIFAAAAAFFTIAVASMNSGIGLSPLMGKFSRARTVWMPYRASAGTSFSPSQSRSIRVSCAAWTMA